MQQFQPQGRLFLVHIGQEKLYMYWNERTWLCIILQRTSTRGIDGKDSMCLFIYNTVYTTVEEAKTTSLLLVKRATLPTDVFNCIAAEIQGTRLEVEQRKRHILKTSPDAVTGSTWHIFIRFARNKFIIQPTSSEKTKQTKNPQHRNSDRLPYRWNSNHLSPRGTFEHLSHRGNSDHLSYRGNSDHLPHRGNSDHLSHRGNSDHQFCPTEEILIFYPHQKRSLRPGFSLKHHIHHTGRSG